MLFFKSQNLKILKILTLDLIFYSPLVISYLSLTQRYRGKLLWEPHFLCELVEIGGRICSGGQDEYKGRGWWRVLEHQTQIRSLSNKVTSYNILKWLWLYHLCKKRKKKRLSKYFGMKHSMIISILWNSLFEMTLGLCLFLSFSCNFRSKVGATPGWTLFPQWEIVDPPLKDIFIDTVFYYWHGVHLPGVQWIFGPNASRRNLALRW